MARLPGSGLIGQLRRSLRVDRREPGRVNHIALGSHCHTAQILKKTGLRGWSAPFDWIFSSPAMVLDCLRDDFSALLDRAQYESNPVENRPAPKECSCRHRLYAERHAIPFVFNHHDPATHEADYRFLADGVRRLRAALGARDARNRFYLMTELPTPDATVLELADALAARGSDNRLVFLACRPGANTPGVSTRESGRPHLTWLDLTTRSRSVGVRFSEPADDAMVAALIRDLAAAR